MSWTDRLREEIDQSFTSEPPMPGVDTRLARGRRALLRRRLAGGAAVLGVVAVLGTTYAVAASGPDRDTRGLVASDPTPESGRPSVSTAPSDPPAPTASPSESTPPWEDDIPIRYLGGELEIRDGVVVHERIRNPYGRGPDRPNDAFDLTYDGQRTWILAEVGANGFGYSSSVPSDGWASFADWVDDEVTAGGGGLNGYPRTMRLTVDGEVVPVAGAKVFQRTESPDLGPSFAPPGATVGAAVVQAPDSLFSYFIVWRVVDGELDVIYTPPRDSVGATFEELLSWARQKYADGEGLR